MLGRSRPSWGSLRSLSRLTPASEIKRCTVRRGNIPGGVKGGKGPRAPALRITVARGVLVSSKRYTKPIAPGAARRPAPLHFAPRAARPVAAKPCASDIRETTVTQCPRRNPPSLRPHRQGGPIPPPPEPTPAERRAAAKADREALAAAVSAERDKRKRMRGALERARDAYRRRRGCPPDYHRNYVDALRGNRAWCGDEDPNWRLPRWMEGGYDPQNDRELWLARAEAGEDALREHPWP